MSESPTPNQTDYEIITENNDCIDTMSHYARYYIGNEESVWVCELCEEVHVDPYEQDCDCYRSDIEEWCDE